MEDKVRNIRVIERAFKVLWCFRGNEELGVTEVARRVGLHKSTAFGLVSTLNSLNIIEKNEVTKKYRLGIELYRLGVKVEYPLRKTAFKYLEQLLSLYKETANLVLLHDSTVIYLDKVESSQSVRINTSIGDEKPLHCTAVGKAILAYMPPNRLEKILQEISLTRHTINTITNVDDLTNSLEEIRIKGYSEDNEELEIGLCCIAAPILNQYNFPFAAISVSGPKARMNNDICEKIGKNLVVFAKKISSSIGYNVY